MTLDPILSASFVIQLHVASAICAVTLGPMALLRRSRDVWHRRLGYTWVLTMAITAVSSFWISDQPVFGPFGPIHILSVITLVGLWRSIAAAKRKDIVAHRRGMETLYFWAMGIAGLFTFLPGRRMNGVFFANMPIAGFVIATGAIGGLLMLYYIRQKRSAI